jgi:hypothetical protein
MMNNKNLVSRRMALKSSVFGILAVSVPNMIYGKIVVGIEQDKLSENKKDSRYPAIEETIVSEVVGVSHFNLDRLKVLVNQRPELARATWDWGFGDWETAIGAASHTGRKDIADYLLSMGARPDIFTFAMFGNYRAVKSILEFTPGLQRIAGPHGISLLQHAKNGISNVNSKQSNKLVEYLSELNDADSPKDLLIDEAEKQKYVGDYKYGESDSDAFSVKVNSRKALLFGKIGTFGGSLLNISQNKFIYNGVPSVEITFQFENEKVVSLTVKEPDLILIAKKI